MDPVVAPRYVNASLIDTYAFSSLFSLPRQLKFSSHLSVSAMFIDTILTGQIAERETGDLTFFDHDYTIIKYDRKEKRLDIVDPELCVYITAAGIDKNEVLRCHFRQNSYLKSYDPHLDPLPLISYSLSGMSTVLFNSKGQPFHPHNAITLIGEKLLHSVPVKPENFNPQTQPRKTILIASDYKT